MQDFTLHTHNNELGWDGRFSAQEMIQTAQDKGFKTIGVSNHFTHHDNINFTKIPEIMYIDNPTKMIDIAKKHIDILENLKDKFKIDIKIGFEVDFFDDANWNKNFEKILKEINVDYLIGASHFLMNKDFSYLCCIYHLDHLENRPTQEEIDELVINHFKNIKAAIKSGYFSFMAHLDYCSIFDLGIDEKFDVYKYEIVEALRETKTAFEINTSGFRRIGRPHPDYWLINELAKDNSVPVLISDDSHYVEYVGYKFNEMEEYLKEINYTTRFSLDMLKKIR